MKIQLAFIGPGLLSEFCRCILACGVILPFPELLPIGFRLGDTKYEVAQVVWYFCMASVAENRLNVQELGSMLRGAQRCSSILTRQLAGRAAALTSLQIQTASLAPLAVLRTTLTADTAPAGAGPAFHSFQSQSIHTSVSLHVHPCQMVMCCIL